MWTDEECYGTEILGIVGHDHIVRDGRGHRLDNDVRRLPRLHSLVELLIGRPFGDTVLNLDCTACFIQDGRNEGEARLRPDGAFPREATGAIDISDVYLSVWRWGIDKENAENALWTTGCSWGIVMDE